MSTGVDQAHLAAIGLVVVTTNETVQRVKWRHAAARADKALAVPVAPAVATPLAIVPLVVVDDPEYILGS